MIGSNSIVESINDVGLSVKVMEDLISRNLHHFVIPSESNNNSICIVVYENERWSSMVKQWGGVLGVHLYVNSILRDRRPLTDETGRHVLSETLSELKPINKFKWREDWTIIVDFSTDNSGFHYATDWSSLSDPKKRSPLETKSTGIRRRRWRRYMVFDSDSQLQTLPYVLTIKIKSASFTGKITPAHKIEAYVETFMNDVLLDRTLTGQPKWNRVIVEKLLYLEPSSILVFQLYRKKRSKIGFMLKGTLVIRMSDIIDLTNRGPYEMEYTLVGDKPRKLQIEWDLKETKLFSLVKMRSRNSPQCTEDAEQERDQSEKKLSDRFMSTFSLFQTMKSSLMEVIIDCLLEEPGVLPENDLLIVLEDLLETKKYLDVFFEDTENSDIRLLMRRNAARQSEETKIYPYGKYSYPKYLSFRTLFSDNKDVCRIAFARQKEIAEINETFFESQPIRSSLFDVRFENYLLSNHSISNMSMTGYELTINKASKAGESSHELHWQTYYDYIMVLKELSKVRYSKYDKSMPEFSSPVKYITDKRTWKDVTLVISYETEQIAIKEIHVNVVNGRRASSSFSYNNFMRGSAMEDDSVVNIIIPFNEIENFEINYSNHMSMMHILEVKVVSLTSYLFRNAISSHLDVDSPFGTHYRVAIDCEAANKTGNYFVPVTISIEKTFSFLLNDKVIDSDTLGDFLYFTFHSSDADALAFRNNRKSMDAPSSTQSSRSLFSFGSSSSRKSVAAQPMSEPQSQNVYSKISLPVKSLVTSTPSVVKESQILFNTLVSHFLLRFKILKGDNIISVDGNEHVSPYFVLYFADTDGSILHSHSYIDTISKGIFKSSSVSNLNGIKPGFFYRSKVIPKSHCPLWNDEVEISSELFPELLGNIKYILIEVWDKNSINTDTCIGEVYISVHSAIDSSNEALPYQANKYALQFSKSTKSKIFGRWDIDRPKLGNLYAVLSTSNLNKPNANLLDNKVTVELQCSIRPLQVLDCAWPCRVLSSAKSGLEDFVLNIFVSHNSLVLSSFDSSRPSVIATNSKQSEKFKALQECVENFYIDDGDSKLRLIIPFSQITEDSIFILSENMIFLTVFAMRRITDSGGGTEEESVRFKGISIDLVVGPCLASDFYAILTNRIALQNTKSKLLSFIMQDPKKASPEVYKTEFQSTIRLMQFEIFSVIENIANTTAAIPSGFEAGSTLLQNSYDKKSSGVASNQQVHFPKDPNCFLSLRVLLYQKAWLRVYYWYLMSFEPLKISNANDEQTFSMKGIETFTNYAKELLSGTISVDEDDLTGQGVLKMDPTSLLYNIGELMNKLVEDVRELFYDSFINERSHLLTSALLSKLVFDQYLLIVLYLSKMSFPSENNGHQKNIRGTSPQDKRDLIVFIISHDDLMESTLHMLLLSYNFSFSVAPLLSLCIDFDKLIGEFSLLLDENLKQWNTRALKHFLSSAERSKGSSTLPWDITTIVDEESGKDIFISSVPETIQMQLNIQIGLKKIPVSKSATWSSLQRICKINLKISAAVAKSYIGLASEFDQVLTDLSKSEEFSKGDDDEMMFFLLSVVNDCHRIIFKHIKESMDSFNDDSELERLFHGSDSMLDKERRRSLSSGDRRKEESGQQNNEMGAIQALRDQVVNLFANSSRVIENVSKSALNHLSNQIFFHSKMTSFFLEGLTEYLKSKNEKAGRTHRTGSISEPISNSPIETICATLLDFLVFANKHLYNEDWEKLVFVCLKKLILRYLIFLRDLLHTSAEFVQPSRFSVSRMLSFRKKKNISAPGIEGSIQSSSTLVLTLNDDDTEGVNLEENVEALSECETNSVTTDRADIHSPIARVRADYRSIFSLYSNTMGKNRERRILAEEEDMRIRESDGYGGFSDDGYGGDNAYPEATYYEHSTSSLLSLLSNTYSQIISGDITESSAVEKIIKNTCYISVPEYSSINDQYNSRLMDFFAMNSMSSTITTNNNFTDLNSLKSSPTYFIQLSDFSCLNLDGAKNCYLRVTFQDNVQETSIQQILTSSGSWNDVIRFNNVQDYQNTVLTVQLVEFRMRPLKAFREKILGLVVVNLSDTDSPVKAIASRADNSDSAREHVFDLSGWFEVNTSSHKFISRVLRRPPGRQSSGGGGPRLSQRAAAARKAATDPEYANSSSSSSSSSSKQDTSTNSNTAATSAIVSGTKSAVSAATANPREGCKNPQLNIQITISRSFSH